ncbi:hypothetical protein H0O02_05100, partial [Candidatus Micrarchaeota archaeon]|nr:hypothetical protein [Candidatus Micrarchaeota archaeon]
MPGCPECNFRRGLFSALKKKEDGRWVCSNQPSHAYTRDGDGNFHST